MALTIKHTILSVDGPQEVVLTPRKAIRKKCHECCCFQYQEVSKCIANDCPLWPYRMGVVEVYYSVLRISVSQSIVLLGSPLAVLLMRWQGEDWLSDFIVGRVCDSPMKEERLLCL